jgi:hypothetical protein
MGFSKGWPSAKLKLLKAMIAMAERSHLRFNKV